MLSADAAARSRAPRPRPFPGLLPQLHRARHPLVGAAQPHRAHGEDRRARASAGGRRRSGDPADAAFRRPRSAAVPHFDGLPGGFDVLAAEGSAVRPAHVPRANSIRRAPLSPAGERAGKPARDRLGRDLLLSSRSRFRAPALGVRALLRRAGGDGDRTVVYCALHRCERRAVRDAHAARRQRLRGAPLPGVDRFSERRRDGRRAPPDGLRRGARARDARAVLLAAQALQDATRGRGEILLKVAIIGAGYMGRLHAEKFARLAGVELVGVADADRARAEEVAARLGCPALPDWRQAMSRAQAAVVAVPTERHLEVAGTCLDAGLHVLVEKPLAVNLEEADRLLAAGARKGVVLQVGHVERYNAAFGALAARMAKPLYIEAERLSGFKQRGADVDVVLDLMIHDLDLALSLAKAPVTQVSACGFRVLTGEIDIANARIEFADGCVASLSASRVSQAPVRKLRVFQTDVYVSANLQEQKLRTVRRGGDGIVESEESFKRADELREQAQAFLRAVRERSTPMVSGEHGRRALELALEVGRLVRERMQRSTA